MKRTLQLGVVMSLLLMAGAARAQLTWSDADIGGPKYAGSFVDNGDGTMSVKGGGWDIWGGWDGYFYHYATVTGVVWEATVRVRDLVGPDGWTKAELMVHYPAPSGEFWRMANYPFVAAMTTRPAGANVINAAWRPDIQTDCRDGGMASGLSPNYPNVWLRVSRLGPVFQMYTSPDGTTWTYQRQWDTTKTADGFSGRYWPQNVTVGIAVTAHNNDDTGMATTTISDLTWVQKPLITDPTVIGATLQPTNKTVYAGREATFYFDTTNNAVPLLPPNYTAYQWFKNGTPIQGATGKTLTFQATTNDNAAQIYCHATCYAAFGDSATATLTVQQGTVYTKALREEMFWGATSLDQVEGGAVGPAALSTWTALDQPNSVGDGYVRRVSGYFIPWVEGDYDFYINTDDDSHLYLSTDMSPANKRLIAQETGWSNPRKWITGGNTTQKHTITWSPDGGLTYPYALGIHLVGGQLYYMEAVHHEGGGGDNLSAYARLTTDPFPFDDDPSTLTAVSNNIALMTSPVTTLTWVTEPPSSMTAPQGQTIQLNSSASTDCEFAPNYAWYRVGAAGAIGNAASLTMTVAPADDNAQIYSVASTPIGGLVITSKVCTLSVQSAIFEPGFVKVEVWEGLENRAAVAAGSAGLPTYTTTSPKFIQPLDVGDHYTRKVSGYFMPPTTDAYVFFICSDDDSGLYLSTNDLPANKRMIAEQTDWADPRNWVSGGDTAKKRSDTWSPDGINYPGSPGYWLTNGQKYYMEAVHHEGTGGDNVGVTYKTSVVSWENDPVNGDETRMSGALIGMNAPRSRAGISQQPANVVAGPYTYVRFSVAGWTDSTLPVGSITDTARDRFLMYQWQKNGVDIPGATGSVLSFQTQPADSGATFTCRLRSLGFADNALNPIWTNSVAASLSIQGVFEPGRMLVEFWAPQYNKDGVLNNTVGLPNYVTTSPAFAANTDGGGDPPGGVNDYARRVSGYFVPPSDGTYDFYATGDDDVNVYLSSNENPTNKTLICQVTAWSGGVWNWQTEGGGNTPQRRSATWTNAASGGIAPYAAGFTLTGGQKYYMEAVHHEGGGGDYVVVTYVKRPDPAPANGANTAMTGAAIGTYVPRSTMVNFTLQPTNVTVTGPVLVAFNAQAVSDSTISVGVAGKPVINEFVMYQWQKGGIDIPGATRNSFSYQVASSADHGATFTCKARGLGYADALGIPIWSNSVTVTLSINDPTPPTLVYASIFTNAIAQPNVTVVDLLFSKRMDPATLTVAGNYTLPAGLSIADISVRTNDYKAVRLTVTGTATLPFNVIVNGLQDYLGHSIAAGASLAVATVPLISVDIGFDRGWKTNSVGVGLPLHDPQFPSFFWVDGLKAYTVSAQGSDIWNTNDGFNFTYEVKTNDFDIAVRQVYITRSDYWAKGGLMARESLNPSSRQWCVMNTPPDGRNGVVCGSRGATAGNSGDWHSVDPGSPPPAYPNAWLRLKRAGNVLQAFSSTNGVNWVPRGTQDATQVGSSNSLPAQMFVGIATTAHNNDEPDAAVQLYWNTSSYADYSTQVTLPAFLQAALLGNNLSISWAPVGGHLESSPVVGPSAVWTAVPGGTANPCSVQLTAEPRFFRVVTP